MPTLLNKDGFKFFFYANEHEPRHIHVSKGEGFFKIELETLRIVNNYMKPKDLRKAVVIVEANRDDFIRGWDKSFAQR